MFLRLPFAKCPASKRGGFLAIDMVVALATFTVVIFNIMSFQLMMQQLFYQASRRMKAVEVAACVAKRFEEFGDSDLASLTGDLSEDDRAFYSISTSPIEVSDQFFKTELAKHCGDRTPLETSLKKLLAIVVHVSWNGKRRAEHLSLLASRFSLQEDDEGK